MTAFSDRVCPNCELVIAQRNVALHALDRLEAIVTKIGGYASDSDQQAVRDARVVLEESGMRAKRACKPWRDR